MKPTAACALLLILFTLPCRAADEDDAGRLQLRPRDRASEPVTTDALRTEARIVVTGIVARADVRQVFRNATDEWMEAVYTFPLPEDAAVDHLRMTLGDRVIEGEIRQREEARRAYEAAREAGAGAALLEQQRPNVFTSSVANVAPGEEIVVEIQYQHVLQPDDGRLTLRFPLTITPRYVNGAVQDPAAVSPPFTAASAGDAPRASFDVSVDAGVSLADVSCPSHEAGAAIDRSSASRAHVVLDDVVADRDVVVTWLPEPQDAPRAVLFAQPGGSGGTDGKDRTHVLLMVVPPDAPPLQRARREVVFVIDVSGSMAGASIQQAREALAGAIERLEPEARFNVVAFNHDAWSLWPAPSEATPAAKAEAARWTRALNADGGTEMAEALKLALDGSTDDEAVRQVVFMTDGAVGDEERLFELITERLGSSRLFTVGIGSAPNAHFMSQAARAGRGTATFVRSPQEAAERMDALFRKLESAVLTDLSVQWPDGADADAWPHAIPDLYAGEPLLLTASLDARAARDGFVRVSGTRAGRDWSEELPLAKSEAGEGLGVLWGRAKIEGLIDGLRTGASEEDVRRDVVQVALRHHLVSRYTSLVAIETTPARPLDEPLRAQQVALALPAGSESPCLPSCGTSWRRDLIAGLALAALAAALLARRT